MRIRVLGGGLYGCHLAIALLKAGHNVELHEIASRLFAGATGNIPARLHQGYHYPRSWLTRRACAAHNSEFMAVYGFLTAPVLLNLYAIAAEDSLIDFGTYKQIMRASGAICVERKPQSFALDRVEGCVQTDERHILVDRMRDWFAAELAGHVELQSPAGPEADGADMTIDATFCAHDAAGIDRFEACLTVLLEGPADRAITIMDGPFPSLYPWDEERGLSSLTSAQFTPLARRASYEDARAYLDRLPVQRVREHTEAMLAQMARYYPLVREYRVVDHRLAIRALPRSAADARLVEVVRKSEKLIRIRAGKMDAIFQAGREIAAMLEAA